MGLKGEEALAIAQKYTDGSIEGIVGALAGKPCQIQSITPITGGNRVTYLWEDNSGDSHTSTMDVMNGVDGEVPAETLLKDTVGWTGKNLNQTKYQDFVLDRKGIDWTYNSVTGIITANGTSTDKSTFGADAKYSFVAPCTSQVILSGCDNENSNVHVYPYDTTANSRPYKDSTKTSLQNANVYGGREVSFYMEEGHNYIITCRINASGITVDNFKFYPMLRKAEISDPTFEPNHKDVVDTLRDAEVVKGKNLVDFSVPSGTSGINTRPYHVNDDDSITIEESSAQTSDFYYIYQQYGDDIKLKPGKYVISGQPDGGSISTYCFYIRMRNADNTDWDGDRYYGTGQQFELPANRHYYITILIKSSTVIPSGGYTFKPMICTVEDWNKSHDYEPYYIPVKDAMFRRSEQRVLGAKNLYDTNATSKTDAYGGVWTVNDDKTITVSGTPTDYEPFSTRSYYVLPAGEYILSWNGENLTNVALDSFRLCKGNTEVRVVATNKASDFSFTITDSDDYDNIRIAFKRVTNNVAMSGVIKPMIRFASDPDNTYTPYAKTNKELTEDVKRVPTAPTTDGTYSLKVTVADGTPTYSWVSE